VTGHRKGHFIAFLVVSAAQIYDIKDYGLVLGAENLESLGKFVRMLVS
jgi:hypothetical protein